MAALQNLSSKMARYTLLYVTVGSLVMVWDVIWLIYLLNNPPERGGVYYLCAGAFLSGVTVAVIGFWGEWMERSAKRKDIATSGPITVPPAGNPAPQVSAPVVMVPSGMAAVPPAPVPNRAQPLAR